MTSVEKWLQENCGVILGICVGVAVVEVSVFSSSFKRFIVMTSWTSDQVVLFSVPLG